jgi:UDP-2,4-diacetamido-2,4,6-trideoxy-beta-L-altropyranose hydrolase
MQQVFIRADASNAIGSGHIMRSIALAQAWQERGGCVTFLSHCQNEALQQRIIKEGFGFVFLDRPHPDPADLTQVLDRLQNVQNGSGNPWLVLDGYHFDSDYQESIRAAGCRVVVIDDYNHLPEYHADILLNQNIGAELIPYSCDLKTVKLLGPQYALLRTEFLNGKNRIQKHPKRQRRIMVTLGGADPDNITLKVFRALLQTHLKGFGIDIILGPANTNTKKLELEIKSARNASMPLANTTQLHYNTNMPDIMTKADMAISAGGSTCWELCFLGIPSLLIIAAENQRSIAVGLDHIGAACCLGWHEDVDPVRLSSKLKNLLCNSDQLRSMSLRASKIVDGKGRSRLLNLMDWIATPKCKSDMSLRKATINDAFQLWSLANDIDVRRNSFNTRPIIYEDHVKWLKEKLASDTSVIYVLDVSEVIVAQIRYDKNDGIAEISYAVEPAFRGKNIGSKILKMTWESACEELGVHRAQGIVKKNNKGSIFSFQKSGFQELEYKTCSGFDCVVFEKQLN